MNNITATPKAYKSPYQSVMEPNPNQGIDLTDELSESSAKISWHEPHPIFVIILVGKDETPYGIQKDLLCAQSPFYLEEFNKQNTISTVEHIVKLPEAEADVFGCFQNFIYTGNVYERQAGRDIPDYPLLMGIWKLASHLKMAQLRAAVLDVMVERRQKTNAIPNTELLRQAWRETEEGSGLRKMFIGWAAEHMRSSPDVRNEFAKSLPQEILSELVIVMSELSVTPKFPPRAVKHPLALSSEAETIDYLPPQPIAKRFRKTEPAITLVNDELYEAKPIFKRGPRKSEPARKSKGRTTQHPSPSIAMDAGRELAYCRDLIHRMLSGPGFWTRLVGPFKDPVDPVTHNAPNYFDVVKCPMDLKKIKAKMDANEYTTSTQFEADVRLIFQNCYEYWTPEDPVFGDCEAFEKYFNEKWGKRDRWNPPAMKMEILD